MTTNDHETSPDFDVAVVGGGTAGLALAAELKRQNIGRVVVLERENTAGGIPRHCGHYPFGLREYGRMLKGPAYAARNVKTARALGVDIRTNTTVTALHRAGQLSLSTPDGLQSLTARRIVLCTGVREASRAQRFVGGDRPLGVMSTGALQAMVYLNGMRPFARPVIFGSELVSFSAVETCRHLGIHPAAMVEENPQIIARQMFHPHLMLRGVPLHRGISAPGIIGAKQVEAFEFIDASGHPQRIETDGVILSGHFRPEAALLRASHLNVDSGSGGPVIDQFGQCSDPAYYSAGNLLRPAETSGWCWREGVATAKRIAQDLSGVDYHTTGSMRLTVDSAAIKFVLPQRLCLTERPDGMEQLQIGLREPARGKIKIMSGENCIWSSPINARPVQRILRPLTGVLAANPKTDLRLTFDKAAK